MKSFELNYPPKLNELLLLSPPPLLLDEVALSATLRGGDLGLAGGFLGLAWFGILRSLDCERNADVPAFYALVLKLLLLLLGVT